jgi:poly-gamma-glutamate synthesis protein (capsule biosynthesis protein)
MSSNSSVQLFLCGDVMTGRGIDQILGHPSNPSIHESYLRLATDYVELAEALNGPLPRGVDDQYIWGDAFDDLSRFCPDVRIINLETSITTSDDWCRKGINYRMHPDNIGCLKAAQIDVCSLANNHILDWGVQGLLDTCEKLRAVGIRTAGAGSSRVEAERPAIIQLSQSARVIVWSFGSESSGVPQSWEATEDHPGVNFLVDQSDQTLEKIEKRIASVKRAGDIIVFSVHWGDNWGYDFPESRRRFAHALIDRAHVDVVHGHSSHHALGVEIYGGKLILYGCGDFITDYEGISGYEEYRPDLSLMYLPCVSPVTGQLQSCKIVPYKMNRFQLKHVASDDVQWIQRTLNRESKKYRTVITEQFGALELEWKSKSIEVNAS